MLEWEVGGAGGGAVADNRGFCSLLTFIAQSYGSQYKTDFCFRTICESEGVHIITLFLTMVFLVLLQYLSM